MLKKSAFTIVVFFLFSCSTKEDYHGWFELTLVDSEKKEVPLSYRKVAIGIRSLKYQLFEHHIEVFEGLTDEDGKVSFRPLEDKEYWITIYNDDGKIYSMSLIEITQTEDQNKLTLHIEEWKLPKNSNGVSDTPALE
ncbi:MAG: hypothetical protein AAGF77_11750 [Bacteroidota bacterium]